MPVRAHGLTNAAVGKGRKDRKSGRGCKELMSHLTGRPLSFIVKTAVDKELSRMIAQSYRASTCCPWWAHSEPSLLQQLSAVEGSVKDNLFIKAIVAADHRRYLPSGSFGVGLAPLCSWHSGLSSTFLRLTVLFFF